MSIWAQFDPGCKLKTLTKQKDMHIFVWFSFCLKISTSNSLSSTCLCVIFNTFDQKKQKKKFYMLQYSIDENLRKTRVSKPLNYGLPQKQGVYQFQCLSSKVTEKHMKSRLQNIYSQHTWLTMCIQEYQTLWTLINKILL